MSTDFPSINRFTFGNFYQAQGIDGRLTSEEIIDTLSSFSSSKDDLDIDCENIELGKIAKESTGISEYLESFAGQFSSFRYLYEVKEKVAYISDGTGEVEEKTVKRIRIADVFWDENNYVYIRGEREACKEIELIIRKKTNNGKLREIVFDSEFLVWLFYKCKENQPLRREFSLQRITNVEFIHQGQLRGIKGGDYTGTEVENAISPMADILQGADLTRLSGEFEVAGYSVDADINKGEQVHIFEGKGSLTDSDDLRRLLISLRFIQELLDLYSEWSHEQKHPPAHFYYDLYKDIENNGLSINLSEEEVLEFNDRILSNLDEFVARTEAKIIDASVSEILRQGESETTEFKVDIPPNKESIAKELVALANYKGGVLVLGVNDDGEPVGLDEYKEKEETIANIIDNSVQPSLDVSIQFEHVEEKPLLVIRVGQYGELPHALDYTFYTRLGTTKRKLTPYQLSYLMPDRED